MAEPLPTAAAVVAGAGAGVVGTVFGADAQCLMIGMVAAILVSFWLTHIDRWWKSASAVGLASLFAGYSPIVVAGWLASEQPGFKDSSPLRFLIALVIGAAVPTLLPPLLDWAKSFLAAPEVKQ